MKKILLSIFAVLFAFAGVQAEEYTYTFSAKQFNSNGTKTLGNVDWTLSGDGGYWGYDRTKGQQFGSGSKPYKSLTLSTSGISGTITKIDVNTSGASGINAKANVTVGGTRFGNDITLTTTAKNYTLNGEASGDVVISYTQTSSKAIYIKSISITYTTSGSGEGGGETPTPVDVAEPKFTPTDGATFEESLGVTIAAEEGLAVYYSTDNKVSYTEGNSLNITETTTVYAYAEDADGNKSDVVKATYTKLIDLNGCSVADAIKAYGNSQTGDAAIIGYIVGTMVNNKLVLGSDGAAAANLVIADNPDETDALKCLPVQLPSGAMRNALNLKDASANLGRKVKLVGSLEAYFSVAGLKSLEVAGIYWSVSDVDYATLYLNYQAEIPETVEAYIVNSTNSTYAIMNQIEGVVPAETGMILKGEGEHLFNITSADATADVTGNLLKGSTTDTYVEGDAYVLGNVNGIGLYKAVLNKNEAGEAGTTHFKNNANKAYLPASVASGAASYSFRFGEGTTGISEVKGENGNVKAIYDLTGRRVENISAPGIYIINGVKTLVK